MVVIRKPLRTKNTPRHAHAPGNTLKFEWKINTTTISGARMPVRDGRLPSENVTGDRSGDCSGVDPEPAGGSVSDPATGPRGATDRGASPAGVTTGSAGFVPSPI